MEQYPKLGLKLVKEGRAIFYPVVDRHRNIFSSVLYYWLYELCSDATFCFFQAVDNPLVE